MHVTIEENCTPYWTLKHLKTVEDNLDAYGESKFPLNHRLQFKSQISAGVQVPRIGTHQRLFEIRDLHSDGAYAGDITLDLWEPYEVDILIFDEYSGKGYATQALRLFLAWYVKEYADPLEATVITKNPKFIWVKSLLEKVGFVEGALEGIEEEEIIQVFHLDRTRYSG